MPPRLTTFMVAICVVLYVILPFVQAGASTCTAVPSVSKCVGALNSSFTKPKSANSFCSSIILKCTTTPTTTLKGTITTTKTNLVISTYTYEELGKEFVTTTTYSWTYTSTLPSATMTAYYTSFVEKFIITTVKSRKRGETLPPNQLIGRAATTSLCASSALTKACSCLITCPTTVTKDQRKTITEKTEEVSYQLATSYVDYTDTSYVEIPFTETTYTVSTLTEVIVPTDTRKVKCTPSATNPSFYLKATNVPEVDNHYLHVYPDNFYGQSIASHRSPRFTLDKSIAAVFHFDSKSRLVTAHTNGTLYAWADTFNDFEFFTFATRPDIRARRSNAEYAYCKLNPPSGNYTGDFQELTCEVRSFWALHIFQYCPIYEEFYGIPLVIGAEASPESPDCFDIVFLVVPVCGP